MSDNEKAKWWQARGTTARWSSLALSACAIVISAAVGYAAVSRQFDELTLSVDRSPEIALVKDGLKVRGLTAFSFINSGTRSVAVRSAYLVILQPPANEEQALGQCGSLAITFSANDDHNYYEPADRAAPAEQYPKEGLGVRNLRFALEPFSIKSKEIVVKEVGLSSDDLAIPYTDQNGFDRGTITVCLAIDSISRDWHFLAGTQLRSESWTKTVNGSAPDIQESSQYYVDQQPFTVLDSNLARR